MAAWVNKWFFFSLSISFLALPGNLVQPESGTPFRVPGQSEGKERSSGGLHPFHVSVVEINHNAADKTLEISCKIFTDDFEKVLRQNYNAKVDLINPPDVKAMDTLVKKYIQSHISISADGRPVSFSYLGFERDNEAVYSYVEVINISSVKKIDITNKLMQDLFDDQLNIMHVTVGGERKSNKLDFPNTQTSFNF